MWKIKQKRRSVSKEENPGWGNSLTISSASLHPISIAIDILLPPECAHNLPVVLVHALQSLRYLVWISYQLKLKIRYFLSELCFYAPWISPIPLQQILRIHIESSFLTIRAKFHFLSFCGAKITGRN
jgi:hypothetical protein